MSRLPLARGIPPSNRVMLRCPPSVAPPDDAVLSLWHALPISSLHQPLPGRTQSPSPSTVSQVQNCSSTWPRTLPLNNTKLEMTRAAAAQLIHEFGVLPCLHRSWRRNAPCRCSRTAPTARTR